MSVTADYDNMSFNDLLAEKVSTLPERVFIVDGGIPYTWSDIEKGANIISKDLAALGAGRRSHIALCGTNSAEWIMAFFAIQRLGAIALLLNPVLLAEDIGTDASKADATHIVYGKTPAASHDPCFFDTLSDSSGIPARNMYPLTGGIRERLNENCDIDAADTKPDDVALMIFSSGTSGRPKGVLHSAYNILSAAWINRIDQRLSDDDRMCLILPLFHIFALVAGLFAAAVADSVIYIPDNLHARTLMQLIDREKCTVMHSVPTMLLRITGDKDYAPGMLSSLRQSIVAGAALPVAQYRTLHDLLPDVTFRSSYGLSEMAPVTITSVRDDEEHIRTTVGRPIADIDIRIVDRETGEDKETNESGEVLVKGHRLMTAYYKVPAGEQPLDGNGWLHTGDLGYLTDDGYLCLSGRIKDIIIRGGENIIPSKVESAIAGIDGIRDVKVMGVASPLYGEEVAACICFEDAGTFDITSFKEELSGRLAKFMMPSYIEIYEAFPTLANGKIDVKSLRQDLEARLGI